MCAAAHINRNRTYIESSHSLHSRYIHIYIFYLDVYPILCSVWRCLNLNSRGWKTTQCIAKVNCVLHAKPSRAIALKPHPFSLPENDNHIDNDARFAWDGMQTQLPIPRGPHSINAVCLLSRTLIIMKRACAPRRFISHVIGNMRRAILRKQTAASDDNDAGRVHYKFGAHSNYHTEARFATRIRIASYCADAHNSGS